MERTPSWEDAAASCNSRLFDRICRGNRVLNLLEQVVVLGNAETPARVIEWAMQFLKLYSFFKIQPRDISTDPWPNVLSHRPIARPLQLQLDLSIAGAEDDGRSQASDGLVILGIDVGEDGVLALFFELANSPLPANERWVSSHLESPWASQHSW